MYICITIFIETVNDDLSTNWKISRIKLCMNENDIDAILMKFGLLYIILKMIILISEPFIRIIFDTIGYDLKFFDVKHFEE